MVEIFITSEEIKKYILLIVLFNAVFPKILENSGIIINVSDNEIPANTEAFCYSSFISRYDQYGLNKIAE